MSINCGHTDVRQSRVMVGDTLVECCNRCEPREVLHAESEKSPLIKEVVAAIEEVEHDELPDSPDTIGDPEPSSAADVIRTSMELIDECEKRLDVSRDLARRAMLLAHERGMTWSDIADLTGKNSPQAAFQFATFTTTKKEG